MTDTDRLANVLSEQFGHIQPLSNAGWTHPPLNVLDCVLSLYRQYNRVVLPRIEQFARNRPEIQELGQLRDLIASYETPLDFGRVELNYKDALRMQTLIGVIDHLLEVQYEYEGNDESKRLAKWAAWARPGDYLYMAVTGFGLAGFQYLRMLFGVQTAKPDVHIIRFVSEVVGHPVTDIQALYLLERAAKRTGLPLREVDGAIWTSRASG